MKCECHQKKTEKNKLSCHIKFVQLERQQKMPFYVMINQNDYGHFGRCI